jgi:hypothetical protein
MPVAELPRRSENIDDVRDDLHALAELWVDLAGLAQLPTSICPLCERNWREMTLETAVCPCCRSLLRLRSQPGGIT